MIIKQYENRDIREDKGIGDRICSFSISKLG